MSPAQRGLLSISSKAWGPPFGLGLALAIWGIYGPLGTLARRAFSGPKWFNMDFGIQEKVNITEKHSIEFRMESTNFTNHPTFFVGDDDINSTTFGKVNSLQTNPRRIQFGLYYRF